MRIAIDAMGGDRAPAEVITGALTAARELNVGVILVGDEAEIRRHLPANLPPGVEIENADQVMEMGEAPTAVRKKMDSSIAVATRLHKEGRADAVLSAGNTGAAAAAALFILERIAGIDRPGIATVFPSTRHPLVLLDAGATVDCRPRHLAEFALMGAVYSHCVQGILPEADCKRSSKSTLPTVGLLSIGEEACKGNDLTKAAFKLLEAGAARGQYSFYGNVEGRDIGAGTTDVVVCDGFVGNVVLKVSEGLAKMISGELRRSLSSDWRSKMGALLLKPALGRFKKRLDYTEFGGAALLGVNGVCIICHGSSDARSIHSAIRIARQIVEADVVGSIRTAMQDASTQRLLAEGTMDEENLASTTARLNGQAALVTQSGQTVVSPVSF